MTHPPVRNFIGGKFVEFTGEHADVYSPLDGSTISQVPLSCAAVVETAVQSAADAFPEWSRRTIKERAQVAYRYRELLLKHIDDLATLIHQEHGKTRVVVFPETLSGV